MTEAVLRRDRRRRRRPTTVTGVIGEILITAGAVVLLYVVWQLWIGDLIIGAERSAQGESLSASWAAAAETASPTDTASSTPDATPTVQPTVAPIALPQPGDGQQFGVMRVPRWGDGYAIPIAGGVSRDVTLDPIGIGHYPDTAMPGQPGNFALAAHRTTYGKPFTDLQTLRVGDAVVIETQEGWYTYRFRNIEYVAPEAVDVLLPVPQVADVAANGSYLTMTTCSPRYGQAERLVAYGVFDSFTPRTAGAPSSLTAAAAG